MYVSKCPVRSRCCRPRAIKNGTYLTTYPIMSELISKSSPGAVARASKVAKFINIYLARRKSALSGFLLLMRYIEIYRAAHPPGTSTPGVKSFTTVEISPVLTCAFRIR